MPESRRVPARLLVVLAETAEEPWRLDALCAQTDPDAFHPERDGKLTRHAKHICGLCEVRSECLEDALKRDERHGVWGGLSEGERRKLKRSEQVAA